MASVTTAARNTQLASEGGDVVACQMKNLLYRSPRLIRGPYLPRATQYEQRGWQHLRRRACRKSRYTK